MLVVYQIENDHQGDAYGENTQPTAKLFDLRTLSGADAAIFGRRHRWAQTAAGNSEQSITVSASSGRLPIVIPQHSTESFPLLQLSGGLGNARIDELVAATLVIPFVVIMFEVLTDGLPQRLLTKQDHERSKNSADYENHCSIEFRSNHQRNIGPKLQL